MNVHELVATTRDALSARTVSGSPVIRRPARRRRGWRRQNEQGERVEGGGIGLIARPAGACVIKDEVVRWQPAFDLNRTVGLVAGPVAVWSVAEGRRNSASSRR